MKERAAINNILTGLKWALKESLLSPHIDYKYRLNEVVPYVPQNGLYNILMTAEFS